MTERKPELLEKKKRLKKNKLSVLEIEQKPKITKAILLQVKI